MRKRSEPHVPAACSTAYPCGQVSITLLPGATLEMEFSLTRDRLGDAPIDGFAAGAVLTALAIGALWDDPVLELEHRPKWADGNLLLVPVAELRRAGVALVAEIHGRGTRALGVVSAELVKAVSQANDATGELLPASGTVPTSE